MMNKTRNMMTLLLCVALAFAGCVKDDPDVYKYNLDGDLSGYDTDLPAVDLSGFDYSGLTASNHPRILMDAEEFETLKARLQTEPSDSYLYKLHKAVMYTADNSVLTGVSDPILYKLDASNTRILDYARKALRRLFSCAYAYRVTGEAKYLDRAQADLLTLCSFEDWNTYRHILDGGEIGTGVGLAYDWLYNDLPESTRALVRQKVNDYLFTQILGSNWNENPFTQQNNRNQVVTCGLTMCALAVWEDMPSVSKTILEMSVRGNMTGQTAVFAPYGNSPEGFVYCNYAQSFEALMLGGLESVLGSEANLAEVPGFSRSSEYLMYMMGIGRNIFNYGDADNGIQAGIGQWYMAWKFNNPSVLYNEIRLLDAGWYNNNRLGPLAVAYAMKIDVGSIQHPASDYWYGEGACPVYLIHTNWGWDTGDKIVGFKGGSPSSSHSHLDGGSFVYDAGGVRWSMDLGMQAYTSVETLFRSMGGSLGSQAQESLRWTLARLNNRYHSTITLDDDDHLVTGKAVITDIIRSDRVIGATMRLTSLFKDSKVRKVTRTLKLVDNETLYVVDSVETASSGTVMRWNMVTDALPSVDTTAGTIVLNKGWDMHVVPECSVEDLPLKVYLESANEGLRDYDYANPGVYMVGYKAEIPAGTQAVFTTRLYIDK